MNAPGFKMIALISQIESIEGERVGSHRQVKANIQTQTEVTVPSVSDPGWHNSQGRPGLPLKLVWHPMQSY